MNVANLENCKKLYELSGWESGEWFTMGAEDEISLAEMPDIPQYDLGYLLRKLPRTINIDGVPYQFRLEPHKLLEEWWASYSHTRDIQIFAPTPEDATCLLAIKLFEEGILKK